MYTKNMLKPIKDYGKVFENIKNTTIKYVKKHNIKSLVLGISGGIDSTLVALLAKAVCNDANIDLIGVNIPIRPKNAGGSGWESNDVAIELGIDLCNSFCVADLSDEFNALWDMIGEVDRDIMPEETNLEYKIRRGNLMARMRMIYLYNLAQATHGLVLSTDNLTEYLLGFWTLHGDVGDYGMIQKLWKSEVYELTEWICESKYKGESVEKWIKSSIAKKPTDGLGVSNGDLAQLGAATYEEVDNILKLYINGMLGGMIDINSWPELINHPVIKRHVTSDFKRNHPFNIERKEYI